MLWKWTRNKRRSTATAAVHRSIRVYRKTIRHSPCDGAHCTHSSQQCWAHGKMIIWNCICLFVDGIEVEECHKCNASPVDCHRFRMHHRIHARKKNQCTILCGIEFGTAFASVSICVHRRSECCAHNCWLCRLWGHTHARPLRTEPNTTTSTTRQVL